MKQLSLIAIIYTIGSLCLSSCSRDKCQRFGVAKDNKILDSSFLEVGKEYYLPRNLGKSIRFSNGAKTIELDSITYVKRFSVENLNYISEDKNDCEYYYFYEQSINEEENIVYNAKQEVFVVNFYRGKAIQKNGQVYTSNDIKIAKDVISIGVDNSVFPLYFNQVKDSLTTFYPKLTLNNVEYDSVYRITPKQQLNISEIFYNTSAGLLGYTYNNGEKWVRE